MKIRPVGILIIVAALAVSLAYVKVQRDKAPQNTANLNEWRAAVEEENSRKEPLAEEEPVKIVAAAPKVVLLENNYHVFQTFNNCGPAALSMALSYFNVNISQKELGDELRPYQNPKGDNDDKSVTLDELAAKAEELGFKAYHRPAGDMDKIKMFISQGIPVMVRTWLHEGEDIGHYRVIKGYNDIKEQVIQDDSYQGKNLIYSYADFEDLWKAFNHEYLVVFPKDKSEVVKEILGADFDSKTAWEKAVNESNRALEQNPESVYDRFNLSVAKYNLSDFKEAVEAYEKVSNRLPNRILWYQIEPILSYYELGNYDKVFAMTDHILNNQNRAFSELYELRGRIYMQQGKIDEAKEEFEKALTYNKNFKLSEAQQAVLR